MRRLLARLAQWWHGLWTFHPQASLAYMECHAGHLVLYCDRCGRVFLDEFPYELVGMDNWAVILDRGYQMHLGTAAVATRLLLST